MGRLLNRKEIEEARRYRPTPQQISGNTDLDSWGIGVDRPNYESKNTEISSDKKRRGLSNRFSDYVLKMWYYITEL